MILTRLLYRILAVFEAHATHQNISLGVCLGLLLGFSSPSTLHFWMFVGLVFLIRLNLAAALFSYGVFSLINYLGNSAFLNVGTSLLTRQRLLGLWGSLYEMPIVPFTNFYSPEVLGKLCIALISVGPIYIISMKAAKILEPILYHWWRTTKLYTLYRSYKPYAR